MLNRSPLWFVHFAYRLSANGIERHRRLAPRAGWFCVSHSFIWTGVTTPVWYVANNNWFGVDPSYAPASSFENLSDPFFGD
jgi:hypothetical protein